MKTVFDAAAREELIGRISSLTEDSTAQWGKMTVYQMLKHCTLWDEMVIQRKPYKRAFMGRVFGKMALKIVTKNDNVLGKGTPTIPEFIVREEGDAVQQKAEWIALIGEYERFSDQPFLHPFFGKMNKEQVGVMAYKHADHHLRQFNR